MFTAIGKNLGGYLTLKREFRSFYNLRTKQIRKIVMFRSSSMAEHSAVNRRVVGSSPTCGAN